MTTDRFCAMGCEVLVAGANSNELAAIRALFAERESRFSRFVAHSELNQVNAAGDRPLVVSPEFAQMLQVALVGAHATGGLVDPTVGHAVVAAGYDRDFSRIRPCSAPPEQGRVGSIDAIRLEGRVLTRDPGVVLDLNGVVKGLTVDDALSLLSGPGFVSAGGDLAVNAPLLVALPEGGNVTVYKGGLATSGTARRSWLRAGERLHHLIDPATGAPSTSRWSEVSVSGATCLGADIAAKAALLLDADGPGWLDRLGLPGRFVERATAAVVENDSWMAALAGNESAPGTHACP